MIKRILFVDDEPNILSALRRVLRSKRTVWKAEFANSGKEGLDLLDANPFDLVVSDMKMPEMDGAEFLGHVSAQHPSSIRIALSGHSEKEKILKCIGPTHQFLSKPCEHQLLIETIENALDANEYVPDERQRLLATALCTLKTPASAYQTLIDSLDTNASAESVYKTIEGDLSLTANLLKITNSAYFNVNATRRQELPTFAQIQNLGTDTIASLAHEAHVIQSIDEGSNLQREVQELSTLSLRIGKQANAIARSLNLSESEQALAQIAGSLSQLGPYLQATQANPSESSGNAKNTEELAPEKLGAYLLSIWGFDSRIAEAIAYQNRPSESRPNAPSALACLHLANHFLAKTPLDAEYIETLALPADIEKIKEETADAQAVTPH